MGKYISSKAIRFCTSTLIILVFLIGLFAFAMACYGWAVGISYAQAWQNLLEACRHSAGTDTNAEELEEVVEQLVAYAFC